ncbi:MAG: RDD family protein [Clostridia bacterium]|nr:RDD family protein [Clostridia bacterium]
MQPAPKGKRFAAYLIDALIISLISMVISLIFAPQYRNFMYNIVYYNTLSVITFIVFVLYFTLFECGSMMGTPGKSLMRIVVVDIHTNDRISFGKALGRALGHYVSAILCIGYIIGLCDENGLALHDRMSGTFVAVRGSKPVHVEPRVEPRPNPESPMVKSQ